MERKDLQEEFEELMSLFLYGEISPNENERLNEIVDLDPALKKRYENYVQTQAGLRTHKQGLVKILFESEKTDPQPVSKKVVDLGKFRNPILALAAMIALIVSVSLIFKQNGFGKEEKLPLAFGGNCDEKSLRNDWILTNANSFCDVEISGEQGLVQFRIFPNSEMRVLDLARSAADAKNRGYRLSILVRKGNLLLNEFVSEARSKTKLYVNGTEIQLTGTKVFIESSEEQNKISVWEGSVRIRSGLRYLFPILLNSFEKESAQNGNATNAQNHNHRPSEIEIQTDWKDLSSETVSNSSLEIKSLRLSEKQSEDLLKTWNGNRSIETYGPEIRASLREIQTKLSENVSQEKKIKFKPENIQILESISKKFGDSTSLEFPKAADESVTPKPNVPKTETSKAENSSKPRENKTSIPKEEPIRLGIKTITLKDGTVLKGNVIQYENQYVLEENGKKRILKSSDIESISF
ncbi:transcriptional regulator [Leptospira kmetyi]|uniref:transcriptional regulator n=1 Tax=Leptospira kmetyi TaxID=408139 RepID=UPI003EC0EB62